MKKLLFILAAGAAALTSSADVALRMYDTEQGDAYRAQAFIAVDTSVTFKDGRLIVTTDDDVQSFPLAGLQRIQFDQDASVDEVIAPETRLTLLHVTGSDILAVAGIVEPVRLDIYDTAGRLVISSQYAGGDLDIARLADGRVYIAVCNGLTAKFVK